MNKSSLLPSYFDYTLIPIVLDLWLKFAYFHDHAWKKKYIDATMSEIVRLYKEKYALTVGGGSTSRNELLEDPLLQHIYKRRHVENESELDQYLKALLHTNNRYLTMVED